MYVITGITFLVSVLADPNIPCGSRGENRVSNLLTLMCVCVCAHVRACTYVCMCTDMRACIGRRLCVHVHGHVCMYRHALVCACAQTCVRV
jgi:hypothetical protein